MKKKRKLTVILAFLVLSYAAMSNPSFAILKSFNHLTEKENANSQVPLNVTNAGAVNPNAQNNKTEPQQLMLLKPHESRDHIKDQRHNQDQSDTPEDDNGEQIDDNDDITQSND